MIFSSDFQDIHLKFFSGDSYDICASSVYIVYSVGLSSMLLKTEILIFFFIDFVIFFNFLGSIYIFHVNLISVRL